MIRKHPNYYLLRLSISWIRVIGVHSLWVSQLICILIQVYGYRACVQDLVAYASVNQLLHCFKKERCQTFAVFSNFKTGIRILQAVEFNHMNDNIQSIWLSNVSVGYNRGEVSCPIRSTDKTVDIYDIYHFQNQLLVC